jgi:hypothetical protein
METLNRKTILDAQTCHMNIRLIGILLIAELALVAGQLTAYSQAQNQAAPTASNHQVSRALSPDERAALLQQAEKVKTAFNRGDVEAIMDLTHPALFRLFGGREKLEQATRTAIVQLQKLEVKFLSSEYGEPSPAYLAGNEIVCFVPSTSLIQINDKRIKSQAYLVAAHPIDVSEWKFIDGAGIESNRELLWMLFPELPREVQLPIWKQELVKDQEKQ